MSDKSVYLPVFPVATLLRWYRRHRRDLPWRPRKPSKTDPGVVANPYHVLVSEAMAQQTQITTVLPYFARFVKRFPTVETLADADEQDVLKLWQGLGYYSRARNLRKAARMIVDDFAGEVPRNVEDLLKLPGVGRYTAGAVASVAYNVPAPIIDGNVARVLARFDGIGTPVNDMPTQKRLWVRAEELVKSAPRGSAGDFNQGLMELGALVCTPKSPTCLVCPLRDGCVANAEAKQESLPVKKPKKPPIAVTHVVLAIERDGKMLFEQRGANGLWANMWQLPTWERTVEQPDESRDTAEAPYSYGELQLHMTERFGLTVTEPVFVDTFTHQTTHRTITFEVFRCEAPPGSGRLKPKSGQWRQPQRVDDLPLAKPQLTALSLLEALGATPRP